MQLDADKPDMEGRSGCVLVVAEKDGMPLLSIRLGEPPKDKRLAYHRNALAKADNLGTIAGYGDRLGVATADANCERYRGAFLGSNLIWSVSGFSEERDEMFSMVLAVEMNDVSLQSALDIARHAKNPYLESLEVLAFQRL